MSEAPLRSLDLTATDADEEAFGAGTTAATASTGSPLEALRAELRKEVERPPLTLVIPSRKGITVTFDTNIDADALEAWRKKCRKRDRRSQMETVDSIKLACTVIANQAREIHMGGALVSNDGEPVLFYSPVLQEMVGAGSTLDAVRMLFGVDGHLLDAADRVVEAAGYGDEVEEAPDPTGSRG